MDWTEERVALLKKLWADGLSASQIANRLGGITRNAAIGKGWWRLAGSPPAHEAMRKVWFDELGLFSLAERYAALNAAGNRRLR